MAQQNSSMPNTGFFDIWWKTGEVKDMLEWMCTYNQGKAEEDIT